MSKLRKKHLNKGFVNVQFEEGKMTTALETLLTTTDIIAKEEPNQLTICKSFEEKNINGNGGADANKKENEDKNVESKDPATAEEITPLVITPSYNQMFLNLNIQQFIRCLGPQYCHPLLTTQTNFTPFLHNNEITNKISLACGLSYMSWQYPQFLQMATDSYYEAFNQFNDYLINCKGNESRMNQNWICASSQLLCLCSRLIKNPHGSNCVKNLINSYKVLQIRFGLTEASKSKDDKKISYNLKLTQFHEDLNFEIENSLISIDDTVCDEDDDLYVKGKSFDFHFNKIYLESFIYNYISTLLISNEAIKYLPNAFDFFEALRYLIKKPIFECQVIWMNYPVLGAALDSFEILAKSCYLFRKINNDDELLLSNYDKIKKLYELSKFYTSPIMPSPHVFDKDASYELSYPKDYQYLRDSVFVSEIVLCSSKILLLKLLYQMDKFNQEIISESKRILHVLSKITKYSFIKAILTLPLFICGLALTSESDIELLTNELTEVADITHSGHITIILKMLRHYCWDKEGGLDLLYNEEFISQIVL